MDRTFASMLPVVQPHVLGCPQPTIVQQIRLAAIRVCMRSLAWHYEVSKFKLVAGNHQYAFPVPKETEVTAVFKVVLNDRPLTQLCMEQSIERYPEWADVYEQGDPWKDIPSAVVGTAEYNAIPYNARGMLELPPAVKVNWGQPQIMTEVTPDKFIVLPLPDDKEYTGRMWVALKPKQTAMGMDGVAMDTMQDAIMHGALQHLFLLPNTNWHDKDLGSYHAKQHLFHTMQNRAQAALTVNRVPLVAQASFL